MMNGHEQCAALLDAYIDGALSEQEAARVREHLTECPECQSYVSDALAMRELFPGLEETPVPEDFVDSVLSSLPARKILWRTQWKKIAAPLAACVAVALLARSLYGGPTGGSKSPLERAAGGAVVESAEFEEDAPSESAELYGVASGWNEAASENGAELETASVTSDGGAALDNGATSRSASSDGVAARNAAARSAPSVGATSDSGAASESAFDGGGDTDAGLADGVGASYEGEASPETPLAALQSADDAGAMPAETPEPSPDTDSYRAKKQDLSEQSESTYDAPPLSVEDDASPDTDAAMEENALPDTDAAMEESAPSDALTKSLSVAVSVWTLTHDAAPIMERYPPDAVTDSGKWYVMTPAEFDELCERFPDMEISSGPESMDASSLPDGAPKPADSGAVYVFAPTVENAAS